MCLIVYMCVNFGMKFFEGGESVKPMKILNLNFSKKKKQNGGGMVITEIVQRKVRIFIDLG